MIEYTNKEKENLLITIEEFYDLDKQVQDMQCIFHPAYAVEGKLNFGQVFSLKTQKKEIIVNLDRNIFTDIVKIVRQGTLENKEDLRKIALLMTWAGLSGVAVMPFDAIAENARKLQNSKEANAEMECFDFAFREIECKTWLDVALRGKQSVTPTIGEGYSLDDEETDFCNESLDYLYHYASMIHFVRLARSGLSWKEQIKAFLQWYFDNSIICQYVLVYVVLYYANQYKVKLPKHAKSKDLSKVIEGCKNQARDLCYLSEWSKIYANDYYEEYIVFFATFDFLLKKIFSVCHKLNDEKELFSLFSNGKDIELYDYYKELCRKHKKIVIEGDEKVYWLNLIEEELRALKQEMEEKSCE